EIEKELINSKSELKILSQNNDISTFKVIILSISIFLFLIVSFFIFINIKNRNKTLKLNNEKLNYESQLNELIKKEKDLKLVYQSKEIRDFAFNISDKIKILETFKNKLQKVSKKIKDLELKKELTTLIISINQNIEVNKEKVVLNSKTTNYKEDFLFNLKNKYPDLSKKEVQVSVYLAMNFSSKEIALQLGVTSRTVDNYRVAVRAKLGLNKKQNLEEFLANFI
ncbi:MAG: hypothetical protein HRT69_03020, partial [Flavobacteriaceae bacterium]|nr:hypothetical protein [Flavobacteriaceae bacterium]